MLRYLKEQQQEIQDSIVWLEAVLERYENRNATRNKDYIECYGLYENYKGKLEIVNKLLKELEKTSE